MKIISLLVLPVIVMVILLSVKIKARSFTWTINAMAAVIYLACLLLLVPVFYLVPNRGLSANAKSASDSLSQQDSLDFQEIYNLAARGRLDQQSGVYKMSSQTFKLDGNTLRFAISDPEYQNNIVVLRKSVEDGKIEVAAYTTSSGVNGIDFSRKILPPDVSVQKDTLSVKQGPRQNLDFSRFQNDFTVAQFKEGNIFANQAVGTSVRFGWRFLVLHIPQNIIIDTGNTHLNMIGK